MANAHYAYQLVQGPYYLVGDGYSIEEHLNPVLLNEDTTEGKFVPMIKGQRVDSVGWKAYAGPNNGAIQNQTFTVLYQGKPYDLPTVFVHRTYYFYVGKMIIFDNEVHPAPWKY